MGRITALELIGQVAKDLLDPKGERWSPEDLLSYLNAGQREVVILRPDANVVVRAVALTPGQTRQSLPEDGLQLVDITRNLGEDGASPGRIVTVIEREEIDALAPDWHSEAPAADEIDHYTYDERSPKTFYVYRKLNVQNHMVEMHFSSTPTDALVKGVNGGTANTTIAIDDIYQTALYDFMLMRAHAKDTDAQNMAESDGAYRRFLNRLGLKLQVDRNADPNRNSPPREAKHGGADGRSTR